MTIDWSLGLLVFFFLTGNFSLSESSQGFYPFFLAIFMASLFFFSVLLSSIYGSLLHDYPHFLSSYLPLQTSIVTTTQSHSLSMSSSSVASTTASSSSTITNQTPSYVQGPPPGPPIHPHFAQYPPSFPLENPLGFSYTPTHPFYFGSFGSSGICSNSVFFEDWALWAALKTFDCFSVAATFPRENLKANGIRLNCFKIARRQRTIHFTLHTSLLFSLFAILKSPPFSF